MKTILITGANGYFGKYLVNHFSKQYQVIACSRSLDKLEASFPDKKRVGSQLSPLPD